LARHVLSVMRPWLVMKYCYDIFKSSDCLEERCLAVDLLRAVSDRRVLPWLHEFLMDEEETIQFDGMRIVDHLVQHDLVEPGEVEAILDSAERHPTPGVRRMAHEIRRMLGWKRTGSP
jgi:hypothetical protein